MLVKFNFDEQMGILVEETVAHGRGLDLSEGSDWWLGGKPASSSPLYQVSLFQLSPLIKKDIRPPWSSKIVSG